MPEKKSPVANADALVRGLRNLIEEARLTVATTVNAALTLLYWRIGTRINHDILKGERAAYGAEILPTLSAKLAPLKNGGKS